MFFLFTRAYIHIFIFTLITHVDVFVFIYLNMFLSYVRSDCNMICNITRFVVHCYNGRAISGVISRDMHFAVEARGESQIQKGWTQRLAGAISAKIIREGSPYLTMQEERGKRIEIDNSSGLSTCERLVLSLIFSFSLSLPSSQG